MAAFSASRYFMALFLLMNLYLKVQAEDPQNKSFAFKNFGEDSHFESQLALYGDAKVVNGSMSVVSSVGSVVYKKPIKVVEGNKRKMLSFSMYFVFSMSRDNGERLAFVMTPNGFPLNVFEGGSIWLLGERKFRFLAVAFDTLSNHVGVDIDSLISVKVSNVSSINLVLNSGKRLQCWIDYVAVSKRLEVRLSKLSDIRPVDPLISYPIDLSRMWKEDEVFVGISSSSGNSSQKCNVYSWSFRTRSTPQWMHSEPLDPEAFRVKGEVVVDVHKRSDCGLRILAALIFGIGCGALGAFIVMFFWTIFGNRHPVVPQEFAMQPKEFEYKGSNVAVGFGLGI
ncbi:Concanavalin A-like lectin family protein [Abeliophyllum distichum]|uniref:Concanavalin A-like lectin family protein n=1 Tax=Abeliophyllum distichum TaxID=126358 RepID=A0ABD1R8P4_9LAMI